jgi:hypothetical protein
MLMPLREGGASFPGTVFLQQYGITEEARQEAAQHRTRYLSSLEGPVGRVHESPHHVQLVFQHLRRAPGVGLRPGLSDQALLEFAHDDGTKTIAIQGLFH